ncbi:hypothetical protein PRIPAC_87149 [Pristionchus pacificus]|uniref:Metalloendopeptidase n=1 Tax=Pristionchus pacificus TaxID=54126 RepID=A0A2A6CXT7_PRIPA|nr:hypothetical protein PRIPAC_87149 [Pristionchus pacificus]|eukprot:PDM82985.1 metallopeptidase [Pristionchus pacificus]
MKVLIHTVLSLFLLVSSDDSFNEFTDVSTTETGSKLDESELLLRDRRAVLYTTVTLWPKNETIKYGYVDVAQYCKNLTSVSERDWIRNRLSQISENFCIKIEEKSSGFRDILFNRSSGCSSLAGYPGSAKTNVISLGSGCHNAIQHEFFHTLGLGHTQRRNDRDNYVNVSESVENAVPAGFAKLYPHHELHLTPPVSYDFKSIMHYGAYDFGGGEIVITPKDLDYIPTMGWSIAPAFSDYKQLNMLYKCGDHCPQYAALKCENGGYPHPKVCGKPSSDISLYFHFQNSDVSVMTSLSEADGNPHVQEFFSDETRTLPNMTFNPGYDQIRPYAFMAPAGKQLLVKIKELELPQGDNSPKKRCKDLCWTANFEFIDNEEGDLTMGGKFFCCGNRQGESFITKSNILGFTGTIWKGEKARIMFTVEVNEPRGNATHPYPDSVWAFPDGHIVE